MREQPTEATTPHTRLLSCTLEVESARAFWTLPLAPPTPSQRAFESYVFGNRSLARVRVLLQTLRGRFAAFPEAHAALHAYGTVIPADIRRLICHWHLQLSDPLYRGFTGELLVERYQRDNPNISKDMTIDWVTAQVGERWNISTRVQFASKLLSSALAAGLIQSTQDPRAVLMPRVDDVSLEYIMYLLRYTHYAGSPLANPYLAAVGLTPLAAAQRLQNLRAVSIRRQGDLTDWNWTFPTLTAWATARWGAPSHTP